ncbi:RNA polymerase sigma factor [Cohnella cellulosilytica]
MDSMDNGTLREIMEQYWSEIWNYAYFLTKDREMARDIAQDAFIKSYYKIATYRGQASFKSWLLAIARNTAFRYKRSAFWRRVTLMPRPPAEERTVESAEAAYWSRQETDELWRIVMDLPDKYREVLTLDILYDLPVKELAALLRIPAGTVKSRLSRARRIVEDKRKEEQE